MTERLTEQEARVLTDQIRAGADELTKLVIAAYQGEADRALKYDRWDAYVRKEFPDVLRLGRLDRRDAVKELVETGMSNYEIAETLGVGETTVRRDRELISPRQSGAERSTQRDRASKIPTRVVRERVTAALQAGSGTVRQIVEATDLPRETVRDHLHKLAEEGQVGKTDACSPVSINVEIIATPFSWYGEKITEYIKEIHRQHELTPQQAKALAAVADAVDKFVATATEEVDST